MRRLLLLAVIASLAATLAPSTASARVVADEVVLGRSIGDGILLQTRARTEARTGAGKVMRRWHNSLGSFLLVRYAGAALDIKYRSGKVVSVLTRDGRYGTPKGIGVSATRADLKRAHRATRCITTTLCRIGKGRGGSRVTDFRLKRGRVISVLVGIVLD